MRMTSKDGEVGCSLTILAVYAILFIGWCVNIYKFAQCDFEEPYKAEIIRGVGIIAAPMGGVIGWFKIDD